MISPSFIGSLLRNEGQKKVGHIILLFITHPSVQFSSVPQSCPSLWDPMNRSMPGLPVHHHLLEFTQIHVHWVNDAIHPSYPVVPFSSCPRFIPASGSFPVGQLFASGGQNIGASASTSVLPVNIQGRFPLGWTGWISLLSKGLSIVFSSTTIQKSQFFTAQPSLWSNSHTSTWLLENHRFNYMDLCWQHDVSAF